MARTEITTEDELREIVDPPHPKIADKDTDHLDEVQQAFVTGSPLFFFATTDADGLLDVSPRGDLPGSVLVLDDHTLAFPDRRGNRRLDSLRNLLVDPRVGMLFVRPGVTDMLRINGVATVVRGADYRESLAIGEFVPEITVEVRTDQVFWHCGNALRRSGTWDATTWTSFERSAPSA
ncbi:MSMEG_1061 family FMN-dependent PPOX-type flavoprotein [Pseudonocardia sp. KRD291]|uniref:MSMEG_1061 family FMN-dependent PPOX-type flavoprotein n=1 Tax=Pseudonocardia sp. KRD291 TaxID=2792007 RepID=UPI001C4A53CB|nr:MSMEG_1061 family FMN-dependent PPOX-type flavoprotein [Pseudonocardia sp. KRD291]MBW0106723.1 pyridoxamine 5'-phosphate oxidase family protein [Pseudonocardia sp. KRD291]